MNRNLVCFDTQIVIWGMKEDAIPEQEHMIARATALIEKCQEDATKIIVPSIVVAELLSGASERESNQLLAALQKHFIVPPFDIQAAQYFAKLWRDKELREGLKNEGATRAEMKADCLIVATAVARGARYIYSHDPKLEKFGRGHIEVRGLPPPPPSQSTFLKDQEPPFG